MAFDIIVEEVRRLSQEEGLNDREIAERLNCARITVNRVRTKENIPKANLHNKKDKTYVCGICGKTVTIRRKERRKYACEECMGKKDK